MSLFIDSPECRRVVHLLRQMTPENRFICLYVAEYGPDELMPAAVNGDDFGALPPKPAPVLRLVPINNGVSENEPT